MDVELEKAIDEAGREKIFQRAREIGWGNGDDPPKWVWWNIIAEIRSGYLNGRNHTTPRS